MGRLLLVEPCPVCAYHIEGPLYYGGSTRTRLFIYYRYLLARCHDCNHIVSVLMATPEHDLPSVLEAARNDLARLTAMAEQGDIIARRLLILHTAALEETEEEEDAGEVGRCTVCGGANLTLFPLLGGDDGEHFDDGTAWLDCPRCDEGRLWVYTSGWWDEIDSGL